MLLEQLCQGKSQPVAPYVNQPYINQQIHMVIECQSCLPYVIEYTTPYWALENKPLSF